MKRPIRTVWEFALPGSTKQLTVSIQPGSRAYTDRAFGADGEVRLAFGLDQEVASAIAIQPDGLAVAAGFAVVNPSSSPDDTSSTQGVFALARYRPDGTLDPAFGGRGSVATPFGSNFAASARGIVLQSDGKIVAVGQTSTSPYSGTGIYDIDIALARYNPDGTLDSTFGSGGKVVTTFSSYEEDAWDIAVQPNGKLVVAGTSYNPLVSSQPFVFVARYTSWKLGFYIWLRW